MAFTAKTGNSAVAWRPDVTTFHAEDVVPDALINLCSTVSGTVEGDAPSVRVAYVDDDDAAFIAEAAEIPESEPALSEVLVFTGKVSQLIRLSREQFNQDGTADQLSKSVGRALVKKADQAFLSQAAPVGPAVSPAAGLLNVAGIENGGVVAGDLDILVDLIATLQANGGTPTHIVLDPLGWAELRKFKTDATASNVSLLGAGTTDAVPMLLSLPVIVNAQAPALTGAVIDKAAVVSAVGPVSVAVSEHQYFSSDSVALRATWRIGQNIVRPDRVGKFTIEPEDGS